MLGSQTSTSLMSRGRSITTDLPPPSGRNWELASPPTTVITGVRAPFPGTGGSAAGAWPVAASPKAAINATSNATRMSDVFPMSGPLIVPFSLRRGRRGDPEPHHVDAAAPPALVGRLGFVLGIEIDQAAQRERQRAELPRERERLRLARAELERGGLADDHALAVLCLDRLVDGQHAHVRQDDLAGVSFDAGDFFLRPIPARENDVDVIVGQDESAGTGLRRDLDRDGPHARGQNCRHVAGAGGLDQFRFADRLAGGDRHARDRADQLIAALPAVALSN